MSAPYPTQVIKKDDRRSLRIRDYISIVGLGILYLALVSIIWIVAGLSPRAYFFAPLLMGAVCGPVYMLYVLKAREFCAAFILSNLFVWDLLVWGIEEPVIMVVAITCGTIADILIYAGKYTSKKLYLLSCIVFNLTMVGPYLNLILNWNSIPQYLIENYGYSYTDEFMTIFSPGFFGFTIVFALAGGAIGTLIASGLLRKHFVKMGIS